MLVLLSKFWQISLGFVIASIIWLLILNWDIGRINNKHKQELADQVKTDHALCDLSKQVTTDVSHDYQTQLADLNLELMRLRQRPAKCLPITKSAPRCNAAPAENQLPTGNGVDTGFLIDFSGRCEQTRLQLNSCQSFILKERNLNGETK